MAREVSERLVGFRCDLYPAYGDRDANPSDGLGVKME